MRAALGTIHRTSTVEAAYHDFEQEFVVVVRSTHRVPGTTSHQVTPMSIEAAAKLHRQLGDVLASAMWEGADPTELPH